MFVFSNKLALARKDVAALIEAVQLYLTKMMPLETEKTALALLSAMKAFLADKNCYKYSRFKKQQVATFYAAFASIEAAMAELAALQTGEVGLLTFKTKAGETRQYVATKNANAKKAYNEEKGLAYQGGRLPLGQIGIIAFNYEVIQPLGFTEFEPPQFKSLLLENFISFKPLPPTVEAAWKNSQETKVYKKACKNKTA